MYGDKMGWLRVMYRFLRGRDRRIWHKSGNQKNEWHNERLTINSYLPYQVIVLNTLFIAAMNLATGHYKSPGGRNGGFGWGGGGHLIFKRTKWGISRNWETKSGEHWKLWKDSEGGPLKFAWKMKTRGGSRKSSKVIREYHFSEVTFKEGIG